MINYLPVIDFLTRCSSDGRMWDFYMNMMFVKNPNLQGLSSTLYDGSIVTVYRGNHDD